MLRFIDIKADNILLLGPDTTEIEETVAKEPTLVDGTFELEGTKYPILRSQPFRPKISWDASPFMSETIQVVLGDLGSGMRTSVSQGDSTDDIRRFVGE